LSTRLVAGLDLGSTGIKILIAREDGTELLIEQRPTPWRSGPAGTTDLTAADLLATVRELLVVAAERIGRYTGDPTPSIGAVAISGMGESGLLVDSAGNVAAPAIAWFDPRGREQVEALPAHLAADFASNTGLPLGVQVSVVKLLNLRDNGIGLAGVRWFNLPEFVAAALGGRAASEYSLASRTGLLDLDTGAPWVEMMDYLGVTPDFLPPLVDAGTDLGAADAEWLPAAFAGARVTVAGHDHLVSAVSGGAIPDDRYHASMGTAEVLLRVLDAPLSREARSRLASRLINSVRHVVPGQHVLVAGVKTGILMRRALQLAGIVDAAGRDELDARVLALPVEGALADGAIEVRGARNDDGVLRLAVRGDGVSPAEIFGAVLRHGNDEISLLIDAMDHEVPPARATVLAGGWAAMASVRRARSAVLPGLEVSHRSQDTAYGAVLFASRLLTPVAQPIPASSSCGDQDPSPAVPPIYKEKTVNELTTLERRAMARILTAGGKILIVAADQRNSMKAVMNDAPDGPGSVTAEQLADAKSDIVTYLANYGPAILLDPEVSLPRVVDDGTLFPNTALVVGMDASGFDTEDGLRYTRFVEGVTPKTVRELGGDVAKMLFYMRPDKQDDDSRVAQDIRDLVLACAAEGVLLIVEVLTYQLDGETDEQYKQIFPSLVAEAARISRAAGAKVLKLAYPGSADGCAAVTRAADGVPWAVLSAGVDHETFVKQVEVALSNGASGAMAGRSLWKDSLAVAPQTRESLLTKRALPRLQELECVLNGNLASA